MEAWTTDRFVAASSKRWARLMLLPFAAAHIAASSCQAQTDNATQAPSPMNPSNSAASNDGLAQLERELELSLPKGARVIYAERQSGSDPMVRATLDMTEIDFQALLGRLDISNDDLRPGAGRLGADRGEWTPHATPGIRSVQKPLKNARFLNLGASESGQRVTLFVMLHGT